MKQILCLIICLFLSVALAVRTCAEPSDAVESPINIGTAKAFLIAGQNNVVYSENADTMLPPAGLSRLAPMLIISEAVDSGAYSLDCTVTVSHAASKISGPTAFVEANEVIDATLLYKSAVMISAGDACYALAESAFGSAEAFIAALNTRLTELNVNAQYRTVLGEDVSLSASDLHKIAVELCQSETFLKYSANYMDEFSHANGKTTELVNPNRFVRDLTGCTGLATGSSTEAGYCGVFSVHRNGSEYIAVILGAKTSAERFNTARAAIEYAFTAFKTVSLAKKGDVIIENHAVVGGISSNISIVAADNISVVLKSSDAEPTPIYDIPEKLNAPILAGDAVGVVKYTNANGDTLSTLTLTVAEDVKSAGIVDFLRLILANWISI